MKFKILQLSLIILFGFACTGCSLTYNLNPPLSPTVKYDKRQKKKMVMHVIDNRIDTKFTKGINNLESVDIKIGNVDNPIVWLAESLQNEFTARGISIEISTETPTGSSPDLVLTVNKYQILSSRSSGFHPYVAYHSFSGKLKSTNIDNKVIAYFFYGKVPVWSMDEVQGPCFDMPESILIKEIAAKINHIALNYSMTDKQLEKLYAIIENKIKVSSPDAYLSVIDLGGSNNPKAIDYLVQLADNDDTLIRASALSAIGMIGADSKFVFLKEKYAQYLDIDQAMALKSIGDIGTPESIEFIKNAQQHPQYENELGFKFIVDLYLEAAQ